MQAQRPFSHTSFAALFHSASVDRQSSQSSQMGFQPKISSIYAGLCFVAVCVGACPRWPCCPEWSGSHARIVCPFTVPAGEETPAVSCCASRCGMRGIAPAMSRFFFCDVVAHQPPQPPPAQLLRTTTEVLSHSLASFNYQAFLMDPLSRSPAKRSKAAEVVENTSCKRNLFP